MNYGSKALLKLFERIRKLVSQSEHVARELGTTDYHVACIHLLKQQVDFTISAIRKDIEDYDASGRRTPKT